MRMTTPSKTPLCYTMIVDTVTPTKAPITKPRENEKMVLGWFPQTHVIHRVGTDT